jgi:uncharacterized membrane protein
MQLSWRIEVVQLALIAAMFVTAAAVWPYVPERIPIHWNLQGEVDGYAGRVAGLLLLPILALGIYALLLVLPRFDPGYGNYPAFATAYHLIRLSILLFLAAVYAVIVLSAFGYRVNATTVIGVAVGVLLALLGCVMPQIRPNWFVGVRTPWTLSSELSWTKTHRQARWVFVLLGLALAAWGIVRTSWMFALALSLGVVSVAWLFVYSYLVYRRDPARTAPAGSSPRL